MSPWFSNLPIKHLRNHDTKNKLWNVVATKRCNLYSVWRYKNVATYEWKVQNGNQLLSNPKSSALKG